MQATIIYNRNARSIDNISLDDLKEALQKVGYQPVYKATSSKEDLDAALADIEGLVVAAGGDGTIRAVATRLISQRNVALTFLPLGTANNISKRMEVFDEPLKLIAGLENPRKCRLDIGYVRSPWGEDYFLEGAGYGVFADLLANYDPKKGKSILRSLEALIETLPGYKPYRTHLKIDDKVIAGDFILVEILNTDAIGPRLKFAPDADPTDGVFEIVCVRESEQEGFLTYAKSLLAEELTDLPSVEVIKGKNIEIAWQGFPFHVAGEVRPEKSKRPADQDPATGARPDLQGASYENINVEILPHALEVWVPQLAPEGN
jgi:diacylglycerol kinase family enzyme